MRKLERWLMQNSQRIESAVTSNSKYFKIKGITIRYSDHFAANSDGSLQIIYPYEDSDYYTVFIKGSQKILIWRTKQIIDFIPHFILIRNMEKTICKDNTVKVIKEDSEPIVEATKRVLDTSNRIHSKLSVNNLKGDLKFLVTRTSKAWSKSEARDAQTLLKQEFDNNAEYFNMAFKKYLSNHAINYEDLLNLYYQIVIVDKVIPNGAILEEYHHKLFD